MMLEGVPNLHALVPHSSSSNSMKAGVYYAKHLLGAILIGWECPAQALGGIPSSFGIVLQGELS